MNQVVCPFLIMLSTSFCFSLIKPALMTNEEGKRTIVDGAWSSFKGRIITLYGGYFCDENEDLIDSVKVFVQ